MLNVLTATALLACLFCFGRMDQDPAWFVPLVPLPWLAATLYVAKLAAHPESRRAALVVALITYPVAGWWLYRGAEMLARTLP